MDAENKENLEIYIFWGLEIVIAFYREVIQILSIRMSLKIFLSDLWTLDAIMATVRRAEAVDWAFELFCLFLHTAKPCLGSIQIEIWKPLL